MFLVLIFLILDLDLDLPCVVVWTMRSYPLECPYINDASSQVAKMFMKDHLPEDYFNECMIQVRQPPTDEC